MMKDSTAQKLVDDERLSIISKYEKEIEALKNKHDTEYEQLVLKHKDEIKRCNEELSKLKANHRIELSQQRGFLEEARKDQKDLKDKIEDLRREILTQTDKITTMNAQKRVAERQIEDQKRHITDLGNQLAQQSETIESLREEQSLLQKAMEIVLRRLNSLE